MSPSARTRIRNRGLAAFTNGVVWGVIDQGVFSVTSFALAIGVANNASPTQFGAFGIAYVAYTLILGAVEAFTAEVMIVRGSHLEGAERHQMLAGATGTALMFGLCCAAVGVIFLFVGGIPGEVVPPLFLLAPLLFLQDVWRFSFFAAGRPRAAALNDSLWAALLAVGFAVLPSTGHGAWLDLVWCWAGAGAICGVLGAVQSRCLPRLDLVRSWMRHQTRAGGRFAGEYLALYGAGQGVLIWVGVFAGLDQSAGFRGSQLLFGPIQVTMNAVRLAVTPIVVRAHQAGAPRAAWRGGLRVAACGGLLALSWGAILLLLPDSLGNHILGRSWRATRPVIPPAMWMTVMQACGLGAVVLLRVVGAYRQTFRIRLGGAALTFIFGGLAATGGSVTASAGVAVAATLQVGALWWMARSIANRATPDSGVATPDPATAGPGPPVTEAAARTSPAAALPGHSRPGA